MNIAIEQAPIRHFPTIDSTNSEAARLWQAGELGPLFVLADEQTSGRGRRGRAWHSVSGNCYSTLLLTHDVGVRAIAQVGFVVSLSVADVVQGFAPASQPRLKWPNDVLVGGAKIAGILSEIVSQQPMSLAIGCGINVAHAPFDLAYPATCIAGLAPGVTRDDVFVAYRKSLARWFSIWNFGENFDAIRKAWAERAIGIGEVVEFQMVQRKIIGRMEGVNADGALLLRETPTLCHTLLAGDLYIPSLAALRSQGT